jgi:anti-anti-sigma factor
MTALPDPSFTLAVESGPGTAHLRLAGDLDHDTGDELLRQSDLCLAAHADLKDLHLDCAELRSCDSLGISTFLAIHRRTTARGIRLHLDGAPPFLERILTVTGVWKLFSQTPAPQRTETPRATPAGTSRLHAAPAPDSSG